MSDLTIGEVGKVLQLNLINVDTTQVPPVNSPLDLTGANVFLSWIITAPGAKPPAPPTAVNKAMTIINATGGVVQYTFASNDLVAPGSMGKNGLFKFSVKVQYPPSVTLYSALDGQLTIKDDSVL